MKKIFIAIGILWESVKSFLLALLIGMAIILSLSSIIHNVFKIREIYSEDISGYKHLVTVDDNRMNIRVTGNNSEGTVVILPDYAESSPIIRYKPYSDRLEGNYKVAVIEYFGYGYSLSTKVERTNTQIAKEIKTALSESRSSCALYICCKWYI